MAIWRQTINGANYSEREGSYKYNNMFNLTSVQMEELLSITGALFEPGNQGREKQLPQIVLHWLGTGQYYSVNDKQGVSKASACFPLFISDRR